MTIPILINFDVNRPIGKIEVEEGKLIATFYDGKEITRRQLTQIFGYMYFEILEGNKYKIKKMHIKAFSYESFSEMGKGVVNRIRN